MNSFGVRQLDDKQRAERTQPCRTYRSKYDPEPYIVPTLCFADGSLKLVIRFRQDRMKVQFRIQKIVEIRTATKQRSTGRLS